MLETKKLFFFLKKHIEKQKKKKGNQFLLSERWHKQSQQTDARFGKIYYRK